MLSLLVAFVLQALAVERTHCTTPYHAALDLRPREAGPLVLTAIHCHWGEAARDGYFEPQISPDGRQKALLYEYQPQGMLRFLPISGREEVASYDTGAGTFMRFAGVAGAPFIHWADDSQSVWTARQQRMRPRGGWAITPLQPIRVRPDGRVVELPPLEHPAGSLDGLLWAGGSGLALAKFGTQGGFYRPERANPTPTLAMVDARRGRVLETVLLERLMTMAGRPMSGIAYAAIRNAFAVTRPNGRIRALLAVQDRWILWDQGRAPRLIAGLPAAFAPQAFDGRNLLVMRPPVPRTGDDGGIVVTSCGGRHGPCAPRAARDGTWAALYDVASGRQLWSLRRSFDPRDPYPVPAISPDGRYALVGLEPDGSATRRVALLSMRDGSIVQTLPTSPNNYSVGFTRGGSLVWVQAHDHTAIYRLTSRRRD